MYLRYFKAIACTVFPVLFTLVLHYSLMPALFGPGKVHLRLAGSGDLLHLLENTDGELSAVRRVGLTPDIRSRNVPDDLVERPVEEKVSLFISLMLPQVIRANNEVLAERDEMVRILEKKRAHKRLRNDEQYYLNRLARFYGCDWGDDEQLELRVNTLPVSLVLAQAIEESGWGTSRFAIQGNSMYGQHHREGDGGAFIASLHGSARVAAFDSIYDATRSYIHTINRGRAYNRLRALRQESSSASGAMLAEGLGLYSERGADYVKSIKYLIRRYELEGLNTVRLNPESKKYLLEFAR